MKILVAIDFSDMSRRALAWALAHAEHVVPHELHLVHVVEDSWLDLFASRATTKLEEEMELLARQAEAELARLPEEVQESMRPIHRHLRRGAPHKHIVQVAEEIDADMLVVGSYGRGGLERTILGSVAERIVRDARTTVVIVRPRS